MSDLVPLKLWIARLTLGPRAVLRCPLLYPEVIWVNSSDQALASQFVRAFQKHYIEEGDYLEALTSLPPLELQEGQVSITLDGAGLLYPELTLRYDIQYAQLPSGGFIGFAPALGVEACGADAEAVRRNLIETIKLDLARHKRLRSVSSLVSTAWFGEVRVEAEPIELEFYTLNELRDIQSLRKKRLLPEVGAKLLIYERSTFGLEEELGQLARALKGRYGRSVLLVGPSGVGKSALVEELERTRHLHGLADVSLWEVTAARLIQKLTGDDGWQQNLSRLCGELREAGDILYVRGFASLFEVGRYVGNEQSLGEYLREDVARGQIRLLSECTDEELAVIELSYPGVVSHFQVIRVSEPPPDVMEDIIRRKVTLLADRSRVSVEEEALQESIHLHRRYTPYSGFPGKVIRFLSALILAGKGSVVDRSAVIRHFCEQTGLPDFMVSPDRAMRLEEVHRFFGTNIYGQGEAVEIIVGVLAAAKSRLAREGKPIASLLFVGPTGVGKTEMAKVLAEFMFSHRSRLVRFDMSEYADLASVLRLTGEASVREGLLTSVVRAQPFCVLLFDELEKAHPSFFDLLLQILGDGRLTDSQGRVADFCSTIIIMTSNIGTASFQKGSIGFIEADQRRGAEAHFKGEVQRAFRPELFNRLDQIVPFVPLDRGTMGHILSREIKGIRAREGVRFREVDLYLDRPIQEWLAEKGYDPRYGARQLQRVLRDKMLVPLAKGLNLHDHRKPLEAEVSLAGDQGLSVEVRELTMRSRQDEEVASTGLTLAALGDRATAARRDAQRIEDSSAFVSLQSRLDILERKKRKRKDRFWSDLKRGEEYTLTLDLITAAGGLFERIGEMETEAVLSLMGLRALRPELPGDLTAWIADLRAMKMNLYTLLHPGSRDCVLAIYGEHTVLGELARIYLCVAAQRGFKTACRAIWLKEGAKDWKEKEKLAWNDDRVVGLEIGLCGPCAPVYLAGERGLHIWRTADDVELRVVVRVVQGPLSSYTTPEGIHRQHFAQNMKARRTYAKGSLKDSEYKLDVESAALERALMEALDRRFDEELTRRLMEEGDGEH